MTDGSDYATVSVHYAIWFQQQVFKPSDDGQIGTVTAVYASDPRQYEAPVMADMSGSLGASPVSAITQQLQKIERDKAAAIETATRKIFDEEAPAIPFTFRHLNNTAVDAVHACEGDADILFLGKRGENADLDKGHLGATIERIIRATKLPCLLTSRAFRPVERALFAYDGSQTTRKALAWLIRSEGFRRIPLDIVTVDESGRPNEAATTLEDARKQLVESGFTVTSQLLTGHADTEIKRYAEEIEASLLIMGAYGHSRIRYLLVGSSTTTLIRECRIPVLAFR